MSDVFADKAPINHAVPVAWGYLNPFGWGLQNSWINRNQVMDTQHNNFISFLRS